MTTIRPQRPTQDELNQMPLAEKDALILTLFDRLKAFEIPRREEWTFEVFFSYAHDDGDHRAKGLTELLIERVKTLSNHDLKFFIDDKIRSGEEWQPSLGTAIDDAKIFIALVTEHYLKSGACREELRRFLGHLSAEPGNQRVLIPILWNHNGLYDRHWQDDDLYPILRRFQWAFEDLDRKGVEVRKDISKGSKPEAIDRTITNLAERICYILGKTCHR